ncbi:hypothetical protein [Nonomuraea ceibae]|uniref:hypothetical protein n=1 Tax=Nonomuraea ceibae TaxID=1935170 RepID=UPI001C5F310F|nr:hypothetical protein [Nonomuraea ceibae]
MRRRVCMVPSNTLSSTQASTFALKIIEGPIFLDYLSETLGQPVQLFRQHVPGVQDWWDVGEISYAAVLSTRHKGKVTFEALRADRNLPRPDISTFNGPRVSRFFSFGFTTVTKAPPIGPPPPGGGRSEIYEIKPRNHRGEADALQKLVDVEASYVRHRISGIYSRGTTYPFLVVKEIPLECKFIAVWRYLMNLWLAPLKIAIASIDIEVQRRHPGVLLYRICVTLDGPERLTQDEADRVANFAVRMLLEVNTLGASAEAKSATKAITESLQPADPKATPPRQTSPVVAGKDLSKTPYLSIVADSIVDEMRDGLAAIRDSMYSRLIGAPGERYFLCCDEAYYANAIEGPKRARLASQIRMLGTGGQARAAAGKSMAGLLPTFSITGAELVRGLPDMAVAVGRWALDHPTETLVIVSVAIVVTAALIVSAGGVALPAVAAAEGTALAGAATTAEIVTAEGAALGMPATIMAQTPGAASVAAAAVPDAVLVTGETAGTSLASAPAWLRSALASRATAAELAEIAGQKQIDEMLINVMAEVARRKVLPAVVSAGAVALVGLAPSAAFAATPPTTTGAGAGPMVGMTTGRLYLIKVPSVLPYPFSSPPPLHQVFDAERYVDKTARLSGPQPIIGNVRMLGSLRVT